VISVDERLALLEGRVSEHSRMFPDLREAIASLGRRLDKRMDRLDSRLDGLERRLRGDLGMLRTEMTGQFRWIVGIQVTTLIAVVAALLGALSAR
jgi:hypothetical protein